ncbi:hypothetical protein M426DRAFT_323526 [Hypoxylon sp. CI-4A]|nr:hypothetical protein M426DRAFT_323526 [Hypoxylon sp. CI-4A]
MTVTELSILPSNRPGDLPAGFRDAGKAGIAIQGEWCAAYAPHLVPDRGAALFQQLEDPSVMLITAHWDSMDQHQTCVSTPANQMVIEEIGPYLDTEKMRPGHIEGVRMFPNAEDDADGLALNLVPALQAPVLSITNYTVPREKKSQFEEAMRGLEGALDLFRMPYRFRGGWKIEKDKGENIEQYFVVGGVETAEKRSVFVEEMAYDTYYRTLAPFVMDIETRHYNRFY